MTLAQRLLYGAIALCLGCGGSSPTGPTQTQPPPPAPAPAPTPARVAGTWSGLIRLTFQGNSGTAATVATLEQSDAHVSGTWRMTDGNDTTGTLAADVELIGMDTRIVGTVTWRTAATGSAVCSGVSTFTGTATATTITWGSPAVDWQGTCDDPPTDLLWALSR